MKANILYLTLFWLFVTNIYAQDITPPQVISASFTADTVMAGDTLFLELDVTDDISGPDASSMYVYMQATYQPGHSYSGTIVDIQNNWVNTVGPIFRGYVVIDPLQFLDSLYINYISLEDYAGNQYRVTLDTLAPSHPYHDGVKVVPDPNLVIDSAAPVLDSIWLERDTVGPMDTLVIKIMAHDSIGTIVRPGSIQISYDNGTTYSFLNIRSYGWVTVNDTFMYHQPIPKYGDNGDFKVSSVYLLDDGNNFKEYNDPVDFQVPFVIQNRIPDHELPIFTNVFFNPDTVHRGDSITMYVTMRDTISGAFEFTPNIGNVRSSVKNPYGQQILQLRNPDLLVKDSLYKFDFKVDEFASDSVWSINFLMVMDSAGNSNDMTTPAYTSLINSAHFVVIPDTFTIIEGRVVTSTGAPLQNSRVYTVKFTPSDSLLISNRATYTDANGNYQFISEERDSVVYIKAIPNDTLYPTEAPTYLDTAWLIHNAKAIFISSSTISLGPFATRPGANFGGHGFVTGFIGQGAGKRTNGDPMIALPLILVDSLNNPIVYATTDSNGIYQFIDVPFGTYSVYADWLAIDNSYAPSITISADNSTISDLDFKVENQRLIQVTTGLNELTTTNLNMYPNPVTDKLTIQLPDNMDGADFEVSIVDMQGNRVQLVGTVSGTTMVLDLSTQAKGLYLIELTDGEHTVTGKLQIVE